MQVFLRCRDILSKEFPWPSRPCMTFIFLADSTPRVRELRRADRVRHSPIQGVSWYVRQSLFEGFSLRLMKELTAGLAITEYACRHQSYSRLACLSLTSLAHPERAFDARSNRWTTTDLQAVRTAGLARKLRVVALENEFREVADLSVLTPPNGNGPNGQDLRTRDR